ncbi:MAG: TonB-dependent receptor [Flavobacteriaceae bacterium]
MPKTHLRRFILCCLLMSGIFIGRAQQPSTATTTQLISYIQLLESRFDVKFSYVDEDLRPLVIKPPQETELEGILGAIEDQTQLIIKKLSPRYYTLSKSTAVDICATVLDNFEQNTVTGASVEVIGSSIATITDLDGGFSLTSIPRKASIRIKHLGFKTRYVTAEDLVNDNPCTTILLGIRYQQLDEVVVFKFLTTGLSKEFDASVLLNTKDFGILPGLTEPDVLHTVQALPGIKSIDETVSDINIRGGTNDQNLILWDGIKMYQNGHFFGLISAFNPYLTDEVAIIKNGASAEYGDGLSGIIDMRTKNEVEDQFFGGAGFNLIGGDLYGHTPLAENLALQFSARRSVTDFLNTPTYDQFFERTFQDTDVIDRDANFYFYDFTGKLLYDINEQQKLRLSFININNNLDYSETSGDSGRTNESSLDQMNLSFGGTLESIWSEKFSTHINGYYTRYDLDSRISTNDASQVLSQNNQVIETSLKVNTNYRPNDKYNWLNGYQLTEVGITNFTDVTQPPFNNRNKGVVRTHAIYSELGYISINSKFRAKGGVRLNYVENLNTFTEFLAEPRLNINYTFADYYRLEVLGELKHQATNQIIDLEQNFLGIEKRRWMISDSPSGTKVQDSLPVTRSKQFSIGLNYDKDNWYASLEGFYKEVDGISTATQGFQNQDQFNGEIGSYQVKGIEFLINHKNRFFSSWLSYTYNINDYTFEDIVPSTFPNNLDITHNFTFASTYSYNDLKLGIGLNYRTGRPFTEPLDPPNSINTSVFPNTINFREPNSSRLPDYIRADASATYDFDLSPTIRASAGASVLNLLNKKNILNTYYRLDDQNEIEKVENISLGLTPNVSFRVSF